MCIRDSIWDAENTFAAKQDFSLPKYYALVEFPYPSGQGLHVGHPVSYTHLHTVRSQREAGVTLEPEENGTTFAENARIKARAICEAASTATIADDSGPVSYTHLRARGTAKSWPSSRRRRKPWP